MADLGDEWLELQQKVADETAPPARMTEEWL
jgi:hypothetical protein